jgi:acyl-[acyl-carrier-protein]-phospholipid O-acyltransferase/long-chain-fatty-acid--[acyl-carrier-protein] ligase
LLANVAQCRAHVPFDPSWVFFSPLPIFHAFGLTAGALLPVLSGMKAVLHPSPLDAEQIPKRLQATGASVLVATDTFARLYARAARRGELEKLRYIVLGGERVLERTRSLIAAKSHAVVLEGYGTTECAPVIAFNQPDANRPGSVGRLLPGMEARLEPLPNTRRGARLLVRGPNVMLGYLDRDRPGELASRTEDWLDTGDLVSADPDGYLTVVGRLKRFAKVGAEMISLESVESRAQALWPNALHAAIAVLAAAGGGGEEIVLVTDQKGADRPALVSWARAHDVPSLAVPRRVLVVRRVPRLATGKPDYVRIQRLIARTSARAARQASTRSGDAGGSRST